MWFAEQVLDPRFHSLTTAGKAGRTGSQGGCADYVIRYENLQEGFNEVCRRVNVAPRRLLRLKTRLRGPDEDYRNYYTAYSRRRVADASRQLTRAFGYRFD